MKHLTTAAVLSIRHRVAGGESPSALALELNVNVSRIWRAVGGRAYPKVGGPITTRAKRRIGKRRYCIRCHIRQDEFAYMRSSQCGVCVSCTRPGDSFHVDRRAEQQQRRCAELRSQIDVLMSTPLIVDLGEDDRAAVRREVVRSMHASSCASPDFGDAFESCASPSFDQSTEEGE